MDAEELFSDRYILSETSFASLTAWKVARPVAGSPHGYKYRLAYVVKEVCVMRFDNEAGKGDHYHIKEDEYEYNFVSIDQLLVDFWSKVDEQESAR